MGYRDLLVGFQHIQVFIDLIGVQPQYLGQVFQGAGPSGNGFEDCTSYVFPVGKHLLSL